jgi:ribosome assembly protein 1
MEEGTSFFRIAAKIPVVESFGFALGASLCNSQFGWHRSSNSPSHFSFSEIRKRSSGAASPQLIFSG